MALLPIGECHLVYAIPLLLFKDSRWLYFFYFNENIVQVFVDDFAVYGTTFNECLTNLFKVLQIYEESNLALKCEECHFMVHEHILVIWYQKEALSWTKEKLKSLRKCQHQHQLKEIKTFWDM